MAGDLRAAAEALANEWEARQFYDVAAMQLRNSFTRDLRAILAEHPATSAEDCGHDWMNRGGADDPWRECYLCGATENTTPAEPDAGGEGLVEAAKEAQAVPCPYCGHRVIWHRDTRGCGYLGYGDTGCPCACDSDMVIERLLADRERRAEAGGAERALRDALGSTEPPRMVRARLLDAADRLGNPKHRGNAFAWPEQARMLRNLADRIAGEGQ